MIEKIIVVRCCRECGYPAKNTDTTDICPSCGGEKTFIPTVTDTAAA